MHSANFRIVTNLDTKPERDLAQRQQEPKAAANWMNVDPGFEIKLVADLDGLFGFPEDADVFHPMHRGVGLIDKGFSEDRIDPALGHAVQVCEEIGAAIG